VPDVIVPRRNAEDCLRLDLEIRRRVRLHLIEDVREAFDIALRGGARGKSGTTVERTPRRRAAAGDHDGS
jgi:hypothetical protein